MRDLLYFVKLFRPHWFMLLLGALFSLLAALAAIALLSISGWLITACAIAGAAAPDGIAFSFNFLQPAAEIRALAIIRTTTRYAERIVGHDATFRILASVRVWLFSKLIPLSATQLSVHRTGDFLSRLTRDIDNLEAIYLRLLLPVGLALLGLAGTGLFLYLFAPGISFAVVALLLSASLILPCIGYKLGQQTARQVVTVVSELRVKLLDQVQGLAELVVFQRLEKFQQAHLQLLSLHIHSQRYNLRLLAGANAISTFLSQCAVLIMLVMGASLFQQDKLLGAEWVMLILCVMAVFEMVMPMAQAFQFFAATQESALRIKELAEIPVALHQVSKPILLPVGNDISLQQVSFSYHGQHGTLLESISLEIPQGKKIAIIGASGVGKTTLLNLLLRYDDPSSGSITIAGRQYTQLAQTELVTRFGVLSQRSHLFAASIRDNLLIAKPDATDDEICYALRQAGLTDFMLHQADALNTWVGEDGSKVSGGEARRIALARVLLKNPPILLLDEPTEGLDKHIEKQVLQILKTYASQKTVIMVTHKLTVLEIVEDVYRLVDGGLIKVR